MEIAQLADGTPVYGGFDNDDSPLVVAVEWNGFTLYAGGDGFDLTDETDTTGREYDHITVDQWARLKKLVASGVLDQALNYAKAWEAQRAA